MTRVLVTGATGVIAGAVLPLLAEHGLSIVTTSRTGPETPDHLVADLCDGRAVAELLDQASPDLVLHLAGGAAGNRAELASSNVIATGVLLTALARRPSRPGRLVVVGSAAEYGNGRGTRLDENAALEPVTPYGHAKAAQSHLVSLLGQAAANSAVHVRPFNVVAPTLPPSSPLGNLRRQLVGAGPGPVDVTCGRLDVERDFVTSNFAARALVVCLLAPEVPVAVNVCSGRGVVLGDLFAAVVGASQVEARMVVAPELAGLPAAPSVVGDPSLLATLGCTADDSLDDLARHLLERRATHP